MTRIIELPDGAAILPPPLADTDPERDAAECIAAVNAALDDIAAGHRSYSLEEVERMWEADKAARRARSRSSHNGSPPDMNVRG